MPVTARRYKKRSFGVMLANGIAMDKRGIGIGRKDWNENERQGWKLVPGMGN